MLRVHMPVLNIHNQRFPIWNTESANWSRRTGFRFGFEHRVKNQQTLITMTGLPKRTGLPPQFRSRISLNGIPICTSTFTK